MKLGGGTRAKLGEGAVPGRGLQPHWFTAIKFQHGLEFIVLVILA